VLKLPKEQFSRDPKVVKALIDDPLLADEVQPTKTVAEMVRADERLKRDFKLFTLPLLIIHGTKDTVTRPEGSKEFYANAGSKDKTLKLYEGYFHDPLSDLGKEAVMADIRAWIAAHL
jgi:acylglycerol lipase